jgi:hypothetical protein
MRLGTVVGFTDASRSTAVVPRRKTPHARNRPTRLARGELDRSYGSCGEGYLGSMTPMKHEVNHCARRHAIMRMQPKALSP